MKPDKEKIELFNIFKIDKHQGLPPTALPPQATHLGYPTSPGYLKIKLALLCRILQRYIGYFVDYLKNCTIYKSNQYNIETHN